MLVRAINRGYFGGIIREPGDKFDIDDAIMADADLRPSWVRPVKTVLGQVEVDGDDDGGDGDETNEGEPPKGKRGRKKKADGGGLEQLPPVTVPDETGVAAALGGAAPDWLPQAEPK